VRWSTGFAALTVTLVSCAGGGDEDRPASSQDTARKPAGGGGVVLARGRAPDGTRIVLDARPDAAGPCIAIRGLPGGERACGRAPSERGPPAQAPISGPAYVQRSPDSRIELYGEAAAEVSEVVVNYRIAGRARRSRTALIPVRDSGALRAAGIGEPFGYFVAFIPARARRPVVEARDGRATVGRQSFGAILKSMSAEAFIAAAR
jgi:hypothetical protein